VRDLAATSGGYHGSATTVEVRSGRDGSLIRQFSIGSEFWEPMTVIGDIDGDGTSDLAVRVAVGGVLVFSANTGTVLRSISAPVGFSNDLVFGSSIGSFTSITGEPLLIGSTSAPPNGLGRVDVISSENGTIIHTVTRPSFATWGFGSRAIQTADLNRDGVS